MYRFLNYIISQKQLGQPFWNLILDLLLPFKGNCRASRIRNLGRHLRAPNNISVYTTAHLTFRAPQLVIRACMSLAVHLLLFYSRGKIKVYSTHHQPRTQSGYLDCLSQRKNQQTYHLTKFLLGLGGKEEISSSQILYNKLEKYLSLFIFKNIYFVHIRLRFFNRK